MDMFNRLKDIYEDFDREYLHNINMDCQDCFLCCTAKFIYPKVSSLEYDFLDDFIKKNKIDTPVEQFKYYITNRSPDICPCYDMSKKRCTIYSARPFCCRMYGLFSFKGEAPLPDKCAFYGKRKKISDNEKYGVILHFAEFMELRYKYDLMKVTAKKERMEILIRLGEEYFRQDRHGEAEEVFEEAYKINPHDPRITYNMGCIYRGRGELDRARKNMELSLAGGGERDFPYIYQNLGFICLNTNSFEDSCKYFEKAIELEPEESLPYTGMAFACWSRGDEENAKINCARAMELDPENQMVKTLATCFNR